MKWLIGKAHYAALTLLVLTPALFVDWDSQEAGSQGQGTAEVVQAQGEAAQTVKAAVPAPAQPVAHARAQTDPHAQIAHSVQSEPLKVAVTSAPAQAQPAPAQAGQGSAATYVPDVSFTLLTAVAEGKLVFVGVGGEIDGVVNPELHVAPNSVVQVTLVNGDGAQHDWAIPDSDTKTELITGQDASSVTVFQVGEDGTFTYFCTVPGHQAAGMEGKLIVGEKAAAEESEIPSIARDPTDLPGPIGQRGPTTHDVKLTTTEVEARLADGTTYKFWTFDNKVPGPMLRVRVGDTVNLALENAEDSTMVHSIDLHAVNGPGGGANATQIAPGSGAGFSFKALNPGLYIYHCATPMVAHHITNGMYGLILVEPEEGLPKVDREFYVMQGELYTDSDYGQRGHAEMDVEKLLDEEAEYFVFNGAVGALTEEYPLKANVGETVRIFFGVGGPNFTSSFHVIGEIFDRVYDQASLSADPLTDIHVTLVPAGGTTMVEFKLDVPGRYILVDHSLSRAERGLVGFLEVDGAENPEIFHGTATAGGGH